MDIAEFTAAVIAAVRVWAKLGSSFTLSVTASMMSVIDALPTNNHSQLFSPVYILYIHRFSLDLVW